MYIPRYIFQKPSLAINKNIKIRGNIKMQGFCMLGVNMAIKKFRSKLTYVVRDTQSIGQKLRHKQNFARKSNTLQLSF